MKKFLTAVITGLMFTASFAFAAEGDEAQIGTTTYATFEEALAEAQSGDEIEILTDISLETTQNIDKSLTISGEYTITSSAKKAFTIDKADEDAEELIEVTFKDVYIIDTAYSGRCIDTRDGYITLNLDYVWLESTSAGNNQTLNMGGYDSNGITYNIVDSFIYGGDAGYALSLWCTSEVNIDASYLEGYCALYFKDGSEGSTVNVINESVLASCACEDFIFGTVVFDVGDVTLNIVDSGVLAIGSDGEYKQYAFLWSSYGDDVTGNVINISGDSAIAVDEGQEIAATGTENTISISGVTTNVEIPEEFWAEDFVQVDNGDGTYSVCNHENTEVVDDKEATCTEEGYTGDTVCSDCGAVVEEGEVIEVDPENHTFVDGVCACGEEEEVETTPEATPEATPDDADKNQPETGDNGIVVFAVLAVVALAGVVFAKKNAR